MLAVWMRNAMTKAELKRNCCLGQGSGAWTLLLLTKETEKETASLKTFKCGAVARRYCSVVTKYGKAVERGKEYGETKSRINS